MSGLREQDARRTAVELLAESGEIELDRDSRLARLNARDRALARTLVLGVLRNRTLIDYYLAQFLASGRPDELPPPLLNILRISVCQLRFLERVPDYAVVSQAVELTRDVKLGGLAKLANAVLRNLLRGWDGVELPSRLADPQRYLEVKYSHPTWMVSRYLDRFELDEAEKLLEANNTPAALCLRDEHLCGGKQSNLGALLEDSGYKTSSGRFLPEALEVHGQGAYPPGLPGFGQGRFYVQDEAAMLAGRLAAGEGVKSLAAAVCAAPGGKATHLARLCPDASVLALDSSGHRMVRMENNLKRLELSGRVNMVRCDARRPGIRAQSAELVLCDVPCSGTGVIRRKPEIRWRISRKDIKALAAVQYDILRESAALVASGGALVYSTCSLEPEENSLVVQRFLAGNDEFRLEHASEYLSGQVLSPAGCLETFPHVHGVDGAFAARMVRCG